jgi:hypothetical protein
MAVGKVDAIGCALDWVAAEIPYAAIVGSPRLDRRRLTARIRSALARRVSIAIRDARVGSAALLDRKCRKAACLRNVMKEGLLAGDTLR